MQKIVVLSGAGISAESGLSTFRGAGGLWEGHRVQDVASLEAFFHNPDMVLNFYNARRSALAEVKPNKAHIILADLEREYDVRVITQNVDDLHERGGSSKVLHLHGELTKAKCSVCSYKKTIAYKHLEVGTLCPNGHQLRPDIVWFGEAVPAIEEAIELVLQADIFLVVGTSLEVYPAAGLVHYVRCRPIYIVDPAEPGSGYLSSKEVIRFRMNAAEGLEKWKNEIKKSPALGGTFT